MAIKLKIFVGIISYINMTSVKLYLKIQNFCAVMKIVACLVVIGGGIYEVSLGSACLISVSVLLLFLYFR